jgi:hypothetical protein
MAIPERGGPDFTFVGFLILATVGSFILKTGPLESSRPTTESKIQLERKTISEVPARLWQDPFKAYQTYRAALQDQPRHSNVSTDPEANLNNKLNELINNRKLSLSILGVMIPNEMYAESQEQRRRRRYAVVSAMATSGFVPENPSHIHITELKNIERNKDSNSDRPFLLPYEWYERKKENTENTRVLVLWLDESEFKSSPFSLFKQVIGGLLLNSKQPPNSNHDRPNISVNIIGPSSSDTLRAFIADKDNFCPLKDLPVSSFNILSATATVDNKYLGIEKGATLNKCPTDPDKPEFKEVSLSFLRTISQDSQITDSLAKELQLRRVSCNSHIALISEWDTEYGRTLPEAFQHSWENECNEEYDQNRIHRFSYLRGIDGQIPDSSSNKQGKDFTGKASRNTSASTVLNDSSLIRRPYGPAQYDYLRRLAYTIKQENSDRQQDKRGIMAIGVLGSDVFDKLLILRALRPKLPGVVFFTTDLDTQLLHPGDFRWTRNLIVASSYGLNLLGILGGIDHTQFPPFRVNYQTSIFTATLHALNKDNSTITEIIRNPPLKLFEIGRNGEVALPIIDKDSKLFTREIISQNNFDLRSLVIVVVLLTIGIFLANRLHLVSNFQAISLELGVVIVGSFICLAIILSSTQEPFSFSDGVSVWPTGIFRLVTSIIAIYFIFTSFSSLSANGDRLTHDYFDKNSYPGRIREDLTFTHIFYKFTHYINTQPHSLRWILVVVIGFAVLILLNIYGRDFRKIININSEFIKYDVEALVLLWGFAMLIWSGGSRYYLQITTVKTGLHKFIKNAKQLKKPVDALSYWEQYRELGCVKNRLIRILTSLYFYMAIVSILFLWFGGHPPPCRGALSCDMNKVVIRIGVFAMLFLLFLVTDAVRICIYWIRGMTYCDFDWKSARINKFINELALPANLTACWLNLELIAERTQEITRLVYYPFFIIFLMLLARSSYFDNWDFSQPLAIVVSFNLLIAVAGAIALRKEAEKARHECVGYLQAELVRVNSANPHPSGARDETSATTTERNDRQEDEEFAPAPDQISQLISNIESIRIGAFSPYREQPIVRASLLLLGAAGLSMAEYGTLFS